MATLTLKVVIATLDPRHAGQLPAGRTAPFATVIACCSSSRVDRWGGAVPRGVILVPEDRARRHDNSRAFLMDTRLSGDLPLTPEFFPDLHTPGHGIVGQLDKGLQDSVRRLLLEINAEAPEQLTRVGPVRPGGPGYRS